MIRDEEGRMVNSTEPIYKGFMFDNGGTVRNGDRNGHVCQIVSRSGTDAEKVEHGPMFKVRFADGEEIDASAYELSPWYPT